MANIERSPKVPLSQDVSVIDLTREAVAHALEEFPTEATSPGTAAESKHLALFAEQSAPAALFERAPVSQFAGWSSSLMHEATPPLPPPAPPPVIQLPYRSIAVACAVTVLVGLIVVLTGPMVRSVTPDDRPPTTTKAVPPSTATSRTPPRPPTSAPVSTRTSVSGTRPAPTPAAPATRTPQRTAPPDDALARVRSEATYRAARQAAAERAGRAGIATRADATPPPGNATVSAEPGAAAVTTSAPLTATASPARPAPTSASAAPTSPAPAPPAPGPSVPAASAPAVPASTASAASAPAPVPSAPAAPTDRQVIDAVLGRYRTAFNELDAVGAQAIWPTVDRRALERAFGQLERQDMRFSACSIDVAGSVASARCSGRTNYVPRVGNRAERSESREWQFSLRKAGDQWNIASVQTQ